MKYITISNVTDEAITFSDGSTITFDHNQDCCEYNYADFSQIEDETRAHKFLLPLRFEAVENAGFRFGDCRRMYFIPCYSDQNGYYTDEIDIYYTHFENGNKPVLSFSAEFRSDWY